MTLVQSLELLDLDFQQMQGCQWALKTSQSWALENQPSWEERGLRGIWVLQGINPGILPFALGALGGFLFPYGNRFL